MSYDQQAIPVGTQLKLLMARGLTALDEKEAKQLLTSVGYFRLKQYISADMLSEEQCFKSGVTFQNIVDRYDFDTEIRNVTFAMCQRVEVTIKATMSQTLSQLYTPVLPDAAFMNSEYAIAWKRKIQIARSQARQRQEPYVSHHWQHYHEFPIWVDLELSTFGALSHLCYEVTPVKPIFNIYFSRHRWH